MAIVAILFILLLVAGVIENRLHQHNLNRIPLRILVNGTRGKTTVTRMTAAMLNASGIRTYAKTTGSEARRIFPDGSEQAYRKHDFVTMMEQLPFVRLAVHGQAQAIVVECMAQRVENQRLMAEKLVRPHYVLMTNAYVDHIEEIGKTEEETVQVLAQSIPEGSTVLTADERFAPFAKRRLAPTGNADAAALADCTFPIHPDNLRLVMALAAELNIPQETAYRGIRSAKPDIGMVKAFTVGRCRVCNAFAANDPVSFSQALNACAAEGPYALLYNHRKDRSYRMEAFAQALRRCNAKPRTIAVIGDDKARCARYMQRMTGIAAVPLTDPLAWLQESPVQILCAGNIKGEGRQLLEQLEKEAHADV